MFLYLFIYCVGTVTERALWNVREAAPNKLRMPALAIKQAALERAKTRNRDPPTVTLLYCFFFLPAGCFGMFDLRQQQPCVNGIYRALQPLCFEHTSSLYGAAPIRNCGWGRVTSCTVDIYSSFYFSSPSFVGDRSLNAHVSVT